MVLFFAFVGLTAEYLFFAGVTQEFAMLLGLFSASILAEEATLAERSSPRPVETRSRRLAESGAG
jgi:hypothetical protein